MSQQSIIIIIVLVKIRMIDRYTSTQFYPMGIDKTGYPCKITVFRLNRTFQLFLATISPLSRRRKFAGHSHGKCGCVGSMYYFRL